MRLRSRVGREVVLPVPTGRRRRPSRRPRRRSPGVHRQDALVGHQVVHHREGRLLDLARVLGVADPDLLAAPGGQDYGLGAGPLGVRVGLERRGVEDREVGLEATVSLDGRRTGCPRRCSPRPTRCRPAERWLAGGSAPIRRSYTKRSPRGRMLTKRREAMIMMLADGPVDAAPLDPRPSEGGSSTMNLSWGERPVLLPVRTGAVPPRRGDPCRPRIASS